MVDDHICVIEFTAPSDSV